MNFAINASSFWLFYFQYTLSINGELVSIALDVDTDLIPGLDVTGDYIH
jgi:hypothetical protein